MELLQYLLSHSLEIAVLVCIVYILQLSIYRLWLSPIAKFPGPKLAALTGWYEFYYDAICNGQYAFRIKEMHKKYGPIVRISPYELHIDDPEYYEVLYSRDSPRNKYEYYTRQFGTPRALFSIVDHYHHRLLRANMNPFFSIARVRELESVIKSTVDKMCHRLKEKFNTGAPVVIQHAFTCFATDVLTDYVFKKGYHYLDEADFVPGWSDTLSGTAKSGIYFKPFPWLIPILRALPETWVATVNPNMDLLFKHHRRCMRLINEIIKQQKDSPLQPEKEADALDQPTLFHDVLRSDLPPEEKTPERLAQEIQVVVGAGAETTAKTLSWITFYLLNDPEKMRKLIDELNTLDPDQTASLVQYEQMPYLTSVMLEGLRLSYGVSTRLQRVAPNQALKYKEWIIPPNTPVGMTSVFMHHNEDIFPDSYTFLPERWTDRNERKRLDKYLVSFSKGSRQCIGMNLAKAELLLMLAKIFRELRLELYETTVEDVTLKHELFLPFPAVGSKGVRVIIVE